MGFGAVIHEVVAGSPAESAGLMAGDIILAFNGSQVFSLRESVQAQSPGDTVKLNIGRPRAEGDDMVLPQEIIIDLTLGADDSGIAYAGISYRGRRDHWNLSEEELEALMQRLQELNNNSSL